MNAYVTLIYSLLILAAAIKGSIQGSFISLFAGGSFSLLLIASGTMMYFQKKVGLYLALGSTFAISIVFLLRYLKGHSPLHALLTILSGIILCYFLRQVCRREKASAP